MEVSNFNEHIILQPQNCLDSQAGSLILQQLVEIVPDDRHKLCIIDMAAVDFIDSSGICALVAGLNAARRRGCRLVICNLSATVKLIFEVTQLDQLFEIFDSSDQIISAQTPARVARLKSSPHIKSQISNFKQTSSNRRANLKIVNRLICQAIPMTDK